MDGRPARGPEHSEAFAYLRWVLASYGERMQDESVVGREQFTRLTPVTAPEVVPPPPRLWSDAEWATICRGHRPRDMDDKWIAFTENNRLFLYRSWTGYGVYEAQFTREGGGWSITELAVSGNRSTYRRATDAYEALFVEALIDGILLGNWDTEAWRRLRSMPRDLL